MRGAIVRLAVRAEHALYGLRMRVFEHILALDLADHDEERRGTLVARVTSDIETLSQFFSWGGIAWLLDGDADHRRRRRDAGLRLAAGPDRLFRRRAAGPRCCGSCSVTSCAAYSDVRERNAELLTSVSELVTGAAVIRAYRIGPRTTTETKRTVTPPPRRGRSGPAPSPRSCSRRASSSRC